MSAGPTATIVIPARNEADDIAGCIEAIAAQDHPHGDIEVLVVDGGSTDATAAIASDRLADTDLAHVDVFTNPVGTTPSNLNVGLARARGRILVRVDARSIIPPDYVSSVVAALDDDPGRAVVGGSQIALARGTSPAAVGIARALNNRLTMGFSRYRRGGPSGPSDTVYLGAFRTEELREAGGWDESLTTNQDFELNRRMSERGAVWFTGGLDVGYLPRSTHGDLWSQYVRFGRAKAEYWRSTGDPPRPRQIAALAVGPGVLAGLLIGLRASRARKVVVAASLPMAAMAVESAGTTGPSGGFRARASSVCAIAATTLGWSWGAWSALLGRTRR